MLDMLQVEFITLKKKYNVLDHKTIGKMVSEDSVMMILNENFLKYFVAYAIVTEGNTAQSYLGYAYNHPLFTEREDVHI